MSCFTSRGIVGEFAECHIWRLCVYEHKKRGESCRTKTRVHHGMTSCIRVKNIGPVCLYNHIHLVLPTYLLSRRRYLLAHRAGSENTHNSNTASRSITLLSSKDLLYLYRGQLPLEGFKFAALVVVPQHKLDSMQRPNVNGRII